MPPADRSAAQGRDPAEEADLFLGPFETATAQGLRLDRWSQVEAAEILDACCGGRHWWWDKAHPLALYMDNREALRGTVDHRPNWECRPDLFGDFRAMPFEDETFQLVLFDPPHEIRRAPGGRIRGTYGELHPDTEQEDLRLGFMECWRVLRRGGTLVFKWSDKLVRVESHFPATPIVGTRSPRGGQTRWFIFYKPLAAELEAVA